MKMLVCTDGSEQSEKAVQEASKLAKAIAGVKVVLLNIYEGSPLPMYGEDVSTMVRDEFKEAKEQEGKRILEEARKVFQERGVEPETRLQRGHPSTCIIKTAAEEDFDMVVMGSRGLSGFKKLLLGSVSNAVVQEARCNVLVVKK